MENLSIAELAGLMAELRKSKPRPLKKLYGLRGPTQEQAQAHADQLRAWHKKYRKLANLFTKKIKEQNVCQK